ncbi:hypothetical protein EDD86DRAFT_231042 [Gorgonomyces haynaldii]|nr:hypothetical protein EDD86DRAFT_231042 [Gorgonomyces haynaldii]
MEHPLISKRLGLVYMLLSTVLFSLSGMAVKGLYSSGEPLPTLEIVALRSITGGLTGLYLIKRGGIRGAEGQWSVRILLFLRAFFGFLSITTSFYALSVLSVAEATVIGFLGPVFTGMAAQVFLGEYWEIMDRIAGFVSMIGVVCIARPSFIFGTLFEGTQVDIDPALVIGIIVAILSAVMSSAAILAVRKLAGRCHPYYIVTAFHCTSIPLILLVAPFLPQVVEPHPWIFPQLIKTWGLIVTASVGGVLGQLCLAQGLAMEKASKALTITYVQAVFAFTGEWLAFGIVPHYMSLVGGALVLMCVFVVSYLKK